MSQKSGRIPTSKRKAEPAPVAPTPHPTGLEPDLMEDLEVSCLDEMRGDSPGPGLARRLERAVGDVLRRHGVHAVVQATSDRSGTKVVLLLTKADGTVRQVVLTVG